jgi:UDP-glucose:(heptosyl)LPS alpha-1,3-glucosyltransferase
MSDGLALIFPAADRRGGVERVALEVLARLSRHRPVTFIGERFEPDGPTSVRFRRVFPAKARQARAPRAFRDAAALELERERPETVLSFGVNCPPGDVYWVHSVHRAWVQSGSSVRIKGIPVPSRARGLLPRHRVLLALERQYFTQHTPRTILCTSQREIDDLAELYGVSRDLMHVVPNGFDAARFNAADREARRDEMRIQLGISDDEISLLFVVNELHRKGFAVLLNAVARVGGRRLRIDIIGRASPAPYGSQISRLGLTDRVHWHGPTSEVERFHAAGDLLVLPTQYEPFGLVIVEALASGLPVITTALAGAAPAVVPGVGLLQEDPHSAEELASLLQEALVPGRLDSWSKAAPAAVAPYEWDSVLRRAEPLIFGPGVSG